MNSCGLPGDVNLGLRVVVEDRHQLTKRQRRRPALWLMRTGEDGEQMLCCFSVTASSPEELRTTDEFFPDM